jgi:hypothetical protein
VSLGYGSSAATRNEERTSAKSGASGAENRDLPVPINVVGNAYRWSGRLPSDLANVIIKTEIGSAGRRAGHSQSALELDERQDKPSVKRAA